MKAQVQYNDFAGNVAADRHDDSKASDFLESLGIDTHRYELIGTRFSPHYDGNLRISLICIDNRLSQNEPYVTEIEIKDPVEYRDYFGLFKRFEALVVTSHYQGLEIQNVVTINELGEDNDQE